MSSTHGFSLFPTTVPKITIPIPPEKNPSLHRISIVASPPSTASNGESIVIKMEQEQPPSPQLPAHHDERRDSSPSPEDIGRAITTTSPIVTYRKEKVATVAFVRTPDFAVQEPLRDEWQLDIPCDQDENKGYDNISLVFDTHFRGFTPLHSKRDEVHKAE
ncbi:hypothetical protein LTR96_011245 [Exophiala xenobiotica]|nr:hypothetical protein LTR92_010938 [Exophiala xenobiotica]KAK5263352.1 hypothetical protein LTR96_011245 [Exophiala xenobiotica]